MEEKIYQLLKQTFSAKYGVGDDFYRATAKSLVATGLVRDENLATVVQGQESTLKAQQVSFERLNTENLNYKKKIEELEKPKEIVEPTKDVTKPLTAEDVAKIVTETLKPMNDKITGFETTTAAERRSADVAAKAEEYGIPVSFIPRLNIAPDANLDDYFKGAQQDFVNIGYEGVRPPEGGKGPDSNSNELAGLIDRGTKQIVESKN